jgi:hypothetical protein
VLCSAGGLDHVALRQARYATIEGQASNVICLLRFFSSPLELDMERRATLHWLKGLSRIYKVRGDEDPSCFQH